MKTSLFIPVPVFLESSGERTATNTVDDYTCDNGAYVGVPSGDGACPLWIEIVHLSNKNIEGATIKKSSTGYKQKKKFTTIHIAQPSYKDNR